MDLIFRLIEFLVQELLKNQNRNRTQPPAQSSLPGAAAAPARPNPPPAVQAIAPRPRPASQDPVYDDRGWRLALTVLALIVLIIMVGVWIVYVQ